MLKDAIKLANKVMALDDEDYIAFAEILHDKQRQKSEATQDDEKPKRRKRRRKTKETDVTNSEPEPEPEKPAKAAAKPAKRQPKQKTIDDAVAAAGKDPLDEALEGVL